MITNSWKAFEGKFSAKKITQNFQVTIMNSMKNLINDEIITNTGEIAQKFL